MTPAETPVDPYPMLTRLYDELVVHLCPMKGRSCEDIFVLVPLLRSMSLTRPEVLALADELRRMAQTQEQPSVEMMVRFSPPTAGAMPLNLVRQPPTSTTPGWAVQVVPIPKEPK